jgi:hypothetical protein
VQDNINWNERPGEIEDDAYQDYCAIDNERETDTNRSKNESEDARDKSTVLIEWAKNIAKINLNRPVAIKALERIDTLSCDCHKTPEIPARDKNIYTIEKSLN